MHESFRFEFLLGGACQLVAAICQVVAPFVLRYLISFAGEAYVAQRRGIPGPSQARGWSLVVAILAIQVIQSLATSQFIYRGMTVGGGARGALISVIFDKALRISARAKAGGTPETLNVAEKEQAAALKRKWYKRFTRNKPESGKENGKGSSTDSEGWGNGRIVNLMSTDTYRIDQASAFFHMIWTAPIQVVITLVLLLVNLKTSALAGFALLVISMPLLGRAIRSLLKRRMAINKVTDQRVTLTQEILQAVRFVKFFGWETSFLNRIAAIRTKEIRSIQILLAIRNGINAVSMSMPIFASMLTFITYSLTDNELDPALVFSSLALFNALRLPLNLLPLVISQVVDALSSVRRIQEFLLAEDIREDIVFDPGLNDAVVVTDASFTWEQTPGRDAESDRNVSKESKTAGGKGAMGKGSDLRSDKEGNDVTQKSKDDSDTSSMVIDKVPFSIQNININIGRRELIAIIGSVGSGKSSLLAALAGDMRKVSGEVTIGASRAFCPQYAWIQNATVRENIIFGKPYDKVRYDRVVDACALRQDFDMLPDGDRTEIGERGITLSGGQKQRLNIARAVYFESDIILLDDPLSAVDAHVGRHIMDNAILGLLKDKCRVLATHQLHVLRRCSRVVWMQDGSIAAVDTFDNLMSQNQAFAKLLASTSQEEEDDESKNNDEYEEIKGEKGVRRKKHARKLMQAEERSVKSVSWSVYLAYIKASGSIAYGPFVIFLLIVSHGANIVTSLWLSWWTSDQYDLPNGTYVSSSVVNITLSEH